MRDFLLSIRADLLDRRMRLPIVAVVVALLAALAYVVVGGGGGAANVETTASAGTGSAGAPSLSGATAKANPSNAMAETTYGGAYQHNGALVDPFKQLAKPESGKQGGKSGGSKGKSSSASSSSSPSGGSGSSGSSGSGGGSPIPSAPLPTPKSHTVYVVDVEFGKAPAAGEAAHLVPFKDIKVGQPVPSKTDRLAVLKSASLDSKALAKGEGKATATFKLSSSGAPIVTGPGVCLPSPSQCESLKLALGQVEELEYLEASGETVTYLLKLTGVFGHVVVTP
jgi:hypothetical protein